MLLPDLKNNHEGQWMLWNPPGASSVAVATSWAGLGQVHLSSPGFQEPPGRLKLHDLYPVIQCVPLMVRTMSELSWIPLPYCMCVHTHTLHHISVCTYTHITLAGLDTNWRGSSLLTVIEAVTWPLPGAKGTSEDLPEVTPEATLVLSPHS